jgi:hypothetical protein
MVMSFKEFLLTEAKLQLTTAPELSEYKEKAQEALQKYFRRYAGPELDFASARYAFYLKSIDKGWYSYDRYTFIYEPIEKKKGSEEIAGLDHFLYKPGTKTGRKVYKSPKDAIDSIPDNPTLGYRGISWEEWKSIRKTGLIRSKGYYNLPGQEELTLWSPTPETAESYASGFAPLPFKASLNHPGVVIAVPRALLKNHKDHPKIPSSELGSIGPLPASVIVEVWLLIVVKTEPGTFDLLVHRDGKVAGGSRSEGRVGYVVRKLNYAI